MRVYDFELPFVASGLILSIGYDRIKNSKWWSHLTRPMQQRIQSANNTYGGVLVISKEDLDALPDDVWAGMAEEFGLQWHEA